MSCTVFSDSWNLESSNGHQTSHSLLLAIWENIKLVQSIPVDAFLDVFKTSFRSFAWNRDSLGEIPSKMSNTNVFVIYPHL